MPLPRRRNTATPCACAMFLTICTFGNCRYLLAISAVVDDSYNHHSVIEIANNFCFCFSNRRSIRQASILICAAAEVSEVMLAKEFGAFQLRCLTD
jgi:hypothetical protein